MESKGDKALLIAADQEELFRSVVETAHDAILSVDGRGNIVFWNRAAQTVFGYGAEEVIGKNITTIIPDRFRRFILNGIGQFIAAGPSEALNRPFEGIALRKDGSEFPAELSIAAWETRDGSVLFTCILRDATERKLAEDLFRTLSDSSPIGIYILSQGRLRFVNPQFLQCFGYSEEELFATDPPLLILAADRAMVTENARKMLKGERTSPYEYRAVAKSGEIRWIMERVTSIPYRGSRAVMGNFMDITERKRAEEERRQSFEKLQRSLQGTIQAMALTVEMRDPYTAGHQRRVASLACAIATDMGLSKDQIQLIRLAGLIHDIGKISVPAEILSKPGRISPVEFSLIQAHPQIGYDVLKTIEFPWPIAQIVLQHHERIDGSGYPAGLSNEAIALEAKILAVADVVEAMAFHRPYRPALGMDQALDEISKNRGVLYDSQVVESCVKLFRTTQFHWE